MGDLYGKFDYYGRLLDFTTLRARVLAHNVANMSTPGFKRGEILFDDKLKEAIKAGDPQRLLRAEAQVVRVEDGKTKANGNNVFFQQQFALMTRNKVLFRSVNEMVKWKYKLTRDALMIR